MGEHYHKVEFLCRKCKKEQWQLVKCGSNLDDYPCMHCKEKNMWMGNREKGDIYPGSVLSPFMPFG